MVELIKNLENLRDSNTKVTKVDREKYGQLENEINVIIKHSADRVTFEKDFFKEFLRITTAIYFEAGFTNCIDILKQQIPVTNPINTEVGEE